MKQLVILTGPVGVGKSTVAEGLGEWLRSHALRAAVIDLDLVYEMCRQRDGYGEAETWRTARLGSAALTDSFFAQGMDVVVVEGGLFGQREYSDVVDSIRTDAVDTLVTLMASPEVVLKRAQADQSSDRILSRKPDVQALLYAEFAGVLPFLRARGITLDAELLSSSELSRTIGEIVVERSTRVSRAT